MAQRPIATFAMKLPSAKAKGRRLQQKIACDLCAAFDLASDDVRSCPGGAHGEDVQLSEAARRVVPWSIECKNQERLNLWTAFEQAVTNAGDHVPVVVAKRNHHDALCTMRWTDALALLVEAKCSRKRVANTDGLALHAPPGTASFLRELADTMDREHTSPSPSPPSPSERSAT